MPSPIGNDPILQVLHSNDGDWDYMEFDIADARKKYQLIENKLWDYRKNEKKAAWVDRRWAFVLPLTTLKDNNSLITEIVNPVVALLLKNATPAVAFSQAKGVMKFKVEDTDFK